MGKSSSENSSLYIFSSSYPFSTGEIFLGNELLILSRHFSKIKLFPLYNPSQNPNARELPENVEYDEYLLNSNQFYRILRGIFNLSPLWFYFKDLFKLFGSGTNFRYNIKQWFVSLIAFRTFYSSKRFLLLKHHLKKDDIVYFYWGLAQTQVLKYLSHSNIYVRIHFGEIDLERHYGYIPQIQNILSNAPHILSISELVKHNLIEKYNFYSKDITVSRLGVFDRGDSPLPNDSNNIRIVSCSNIYPIKRINLIIEALSKIEDIKVEWIHFGGGLLFEEIKALANDVLNSNISFEIMGKVPNNTILEYYKNKYVDLFVNVSISEGIPVSIMEAMSFGIPCFATNVGATNELVNNEIGYLVEADFNPVELVNSIRTVRKDFSSERRKKVKSFWKSNYDAETNYKNLASLLKR